MADDLDGRLVVRMEATLARFERQLQQGRRQTREAAQDMERQLSLIGSRGDARRFRGFSMQLSQAMQSVAAGTPTLTAFSMQIADMTRYMGPLGIVIGATAGALIPLAANMLGVNTQADSLQSRMDGLRAKVDAFREANDTFSVEGLQKVREKYGEINEEITTLITNQRTYAAEAAAKGAKDAAAAFRSEITGGVSGMFRTDPAQIAKFLGVELSQRVEQVTYEAGEAVTRAYRTVNPAVTEFGSALDALAAATGPEEIADAAARMTELLKGTTAEGSAFAGKMLETEATMRELVQVTAQVPDALKDGKVTAGELNDELAKGADNAERMRDAVRALGDDERGSQRAGSRDIAELRTRQWQERASWAGDQGVRVDYAMGPARPNAPSREIIEIIAAAVREGLGEGARVIVTSGQENPGQQHGSNRHRTGLAADVAIYAPDGTRLTAGDRRMADVARAAARRGALGIGFGADYMGGDHMHIDAVRPGPGQAHAWGSGGAAMRDELAGLMGGKSGAEAVRLTDAARDALDRLRATIDPTVKAQQQLAEAEEAVAAAVARGIIGREEGQAVLEQYRQHIIATSDEMQRALAKIKETLDDNEQAARSVVEGFIGDLRNGVSVADAFANALGRVADRWIEMSLNGMGDMGWFGQLGGWLFGGGGGGTGTLGLPSFDGGGFTGGGGRSGGLDGKGGFLAMLHPNETVTDHTRKGPGAQAGSAVDVRLHVDRDGNWQAAVARIAEGRARAMVPAAVAATGRAMSRTKGFGAGK